MTLVERFCIQHVSNVKYLKMKMNPPIKLYNDNWRRTFAWEALGSYKAMERFRQRSGYGWSYFTMGDVAFKRSFYVNVLFGY